MQTMLGMLLIATALAAPGGGKGGSASTATCTGGEDLVLDSGKAWTVTGECGQVTVEGKGMAVTIASLKGLVMKGNGIAVTYTTNASGLPKLPSDFKDCSGCTYSQVP